MSSCISGSHQRPMHSKRSAQKQRSNHRENRYLDRILHSRFDDVDCGREDEPSAPSEIEEYSQGVLTAVPTNPPTAPETKLLNNSPDFDCEAMSQRNPAGESSILTSARGIKARTWKMHPKYPPFQVTCLSRMSIFYRERRFELLTSRKSARVQRRVPKDLPCERSAQRRPSVLCRYCFYLADGS